VCGFLSLFYFIKGISLKNDKILLSHGSGGRLMHKLISDLFIKHFSNPILNKLNDQAFLKLDSNNVAFTTDSYVVDPIFFPGGNIGDLAVNGTINDLAVGGAKPLYLSTGFIIEEGFPLEDLEKIIISMKNACSFSEVEIVTGDTKIVNKNSVDKIFINTSGIGVFYENVHLSADNVKVGDKIILSGSIGDHGLAILSSRSGIDLHSNIKSDTRSLKGLANAMLSFTKKINCMRDPTRGGVATTLNEISEQSNVGMEIYQNKIPVHEDVQAACDILGFDPLYIANEGKLLAFADKDVADDLLKVMKNHPDGHESEIIGEVVEKHPKRVLLRTNIGGSRIVDMLTGEQLPRIC
jgi:hydrogenase expression/formation protein HypE